MTKNWLAAAIILGGLGLGPAKADVTYVFVDLEDPGQTDLSFSVPVQLSAANPSENFTALGGAYKQGPFDHGQAEFQFLDSGNPEIFFSDPLNGGSGAFVFTSITTTPGNGGAFKGLGGLYINVTTPLADLGSAYVSGVPATPEPSTWALLCLGFSGLAALGLRKRRGESPRLA